MAIPTMLRLGDLVIHLMVVCDDIDEDDRDAILVRTLVQNPTKNKLKSPNLNIKTSGAQVQIFKSLDSQISGNSQDEALHFLPKKPGAWILAAEHLGKQGELGPFPGDYRMEMDLEEIPVVAEISDDVLSDVFEDALAGFGMEESMFNEVPINEGGDPLAAAFAHGLNASPPHTTEINSISKSENKEVSTSPITGPTLTGPPQAPAMTEPPQGPAMTGPPQGPPMTGPPQGPPMTGPPQGPPMTGPPQGPPMTGPPQGPPMTGPPQGPAMTEPPQGPAMTGPPQGPPMTGPPQGPPMTGPPQGPPMTGPPQGPPMTGPPQGPKSGPKGPPKK